MKMNVQGLVWRLYIKLSDSIVSLRIFTLILRLRIRNRDVGERLDGLVRLILPSPSKESVVLLHNGCQMVFPAGYQDVESYRGRIYEQDVTHIFTNCLRDGMTVVDAGAHLGYYTLLASKLVASSGHVYAFEPDPKHFPFLLRNVQANGCGNVTAVQKAIGDKPGTLVLFSQFRSGGSNLYLDPGGGTPVQVEVVTLDHFMATEAWPRVDLIKMDIEGAEKAALEGAAELISRNSELKLIIEFQPKWMRAAGYSPQELLCTLGELGFTKLYLIGGSLKPVFGPEGLKVLISMSNRVTPYILCERV